MKAASKGLEVVCGIGRMVPMTVIGDCGRLKQVILYLLSNAIKFTPCGDIEMCVELESETATHHCLKISVSDTGIGIPEELQSELFNRFSQVDSSTTRSYSGMGLGLAISKQLVELMSGTMGVTSTPGEGSTFWFTVMLEKTETLIEDSRRLPSDCSTIVVSHSSLTRNVLTSQLQAWGAHVSAAADEKEAKIYLNANRIGHTAIIHLTIPENDIATLDSIMSFIAASIMQVRFWILLCPIRFVGQIRDLVADMAESFAAKGNTLAEAVALGMVIIPKPVRQKVLYDCLTQLHTGGVYRKPAGRSTNDTGADMIGGEGYHEAGVQVEMFSKLHDRRHVGSTDVCAGIDRSFSNTGTEASSVKACYPLKRWDSAKVLVAEDLQPTELSDHQLAADAKSSPPPRPRVSFQGENMPTSATPSSARSSEPRPRVSFQGEDMPTSATPSPVRSSEVLANFKKTASNDARYLLLVAEDNGRGVSSGR